MKEEKASNSCRKNLNDSEMESVSGGVGFGVSRSSSFEGKIGKPIYGQCYKCGETIITGYYGKNTAPPRHICGRSFYI